MLTRNIVMPFSAFFASVVLLAQYGTNAPCLETPSLFAERNVITFRPQLPHIRLHNQPIEQWVTTMQSGTALPHTSGVLIHHQQYQLMPGVHSTANDPVVFIFSRGFEPKPCAARAAYLYEKQIVPHNCPVISFDYDDSRTHFSFGQQEDIALLRNLYHAILKQNPAAHIIIIGNCNGAKAALELAAEQPNNLRALILLTPFISAQSVIRQIARTYLLGVPGTHTLLYTLVRTLTAYTPQQDDLATRLHKIDRHIPIFIGQRMYDRVVPDSEVQALALQLQQQGNCVEGLITYDPTRSHNGLIYNKKIPYRIARFLKRHHLPYNRRAYLHSYEG